MGTGKSPKVGADDYIASGRGPDDLEARPRTRLGPVAPVELHELLAREYPEPPAIIGGGIVPRQGLVVLGGPPKRGKSLLALQQVLARALGWPWLGSATTPGRTLVIQAEIPEHKLQARLRLMLSALAAEIPPDLVHFVTYRGLYVDRPEGLRACRTLIETLKPDFLQIDPLGRFFSGDENSTRDMGRFIAALDELIQTYGVAIEVIHHTAKPSSDDPREGGLRLRGSSALFGAADSVLLLDRDGPDRFKLAFELRHGPESQPMLLRRSSALWLEPAGPPEDLLLVAGVVRPLPLGWQQLVNALHADHGWSRATAARRIREAVNAGLVSRNGDGRYVSGLTGSHEGARPEASGDA